ncbi:major facilitator superfamily domain-containing protein [Cordyceps javanica]|nr:major facilitator superfamily domain-containing protein [Cordyceps javanica]
MQIAFLVVWARASDLLGRKTTLIASLFIFTIFSLACGLSQTMNIVFRAFQGLGGAGLYSLAMTVMTEVTPVQYIGVAVGLMGGIFATSSILGTMLGGIIASAAACLPPGVICLLIVIFIFPVNPEPLPLTWHTLEGIDFLGVATLLGGCIPLIFALESGGIHYRWNSSVVVVTLVVGGVSLFGFITWQWYIYKRQANRYILPLFPARIVSSAFFSGFPFMAILIFLPQRLQVQNGLSPMQAGVDMLALLLLTATGSGLGGVVSARVRIKGIAWYMMASAIPLQIVGLGLLTTLPDGASAVPSRQYDGGCKAGG